MSNNFFGISPYGATPSYRQINHLKLGKKAFFHFGVNTFSDTEWGDGSERESLFNPTDIDIRGWVRSVKAAGFKLAIITAKHHDGFCLWPSKYTEHSVKNSPYKNGKGDIIKEFTDACHEFGVKVGIYVSPWDRNSPYWGTSDYSIYYANQLEEILTQYGKIDEIWWDGAGSAEAKYDWGRWAFLVRKHQPDAVMFGSMGATPYVEMRWVGNEAGFAGPTHYASLDTEMLVKETVADINRGKIGGELYIPAEVDVSIRPGWFYHKEQDSKVKSPRELDKIWFRSVANNAIMLLNFPPDRRGKLVDKDVSNAIDSNRRIERMLSVNYLDGAQIEADSSYCAETGIEKAVFKDDELFYATAPDKSEVRIDIEITDGSVFNTIMLGEKVELGERITDFTLECLDGDTPETLCVGTSVGYLRGLRFKTGSYRRLRLTVKGLVAPVTLRTIALHYYEEDLSDHINTVQKDNLARLGTSKIEYSADRKTANILFGGIYPFDTVSFLCHLPSEYEISAFDGSKFYSIATGNNPDYRVNVRFDEPIEGSYQIKIYASKGLALDPDFIVT